MKALGLDPLPVYTPPAECPETDPQLAARFPLQLVSPPSPHFLNSTFVNVDSLRRSARQPELEIHRVDAASRALRVKVLNLECDVQADVAWLEFRLTRGAFATAVVRELVRVAD